MTLISKFRTLFTRLTHPQELLVYVAIWLLVYLFPIVNEALGTTQEAEFSSMAKTTAIDGACLPASVRLAYSPYAISLEFKLSKYILLLLTQNSRHWQRTANICERGRTKRFFLFFVRMIGLEPTCREALAPETSVSTISPHPRSKVLQRYEIFLN